MRHTLPHSTKEPPLLLTYICNLCNKSKNGILLQNCSKLLWEQFIQIERSEQCWQQIAFLTCSWRFLISNKLEQLEFKLEKKYWDLETCRKSLKNFLLHLVRGYPIITWTGLNIKINVAQKVYELCLFWYLAQSR